MYSNFGLISSRKSVAVMAHVCHALPGLMVQMVRYDDGPVLQ
jgi:hypothetical protein